PRRVDSRHDLLDVLRGRVQRGDLLRWEVIRGVPTLTAPGDPGVVEHLLARRQRRARWRDRVLDHVLDADGAVEVLMGVILLGRQRLHLSRLALVRMHALADCTGVGADASYQTADPADEARPAPEALADSARSLERAMPVNRAGLSL